jgi:transcriptional regulator with XRE-family HTH domain
MLIGERLRMLRESKNLTQGDIEQLTGMVRPYISRIENGMSVPSVGTLEKFARGIGIPVYQIFVDIEAARSDSLVVKKQESGFGSTTTEAKFFARFRRALSRITKKDSKLVLDTAIQMVRRPRKSKR